jgi:hypothetical protein
VNHLSETIYIQSTCLKFSKFSRKETNNPIFKMSKILEGTPCDQGFGVKGVGQWQRECPACMRPGFNPSSHWNIPLN